MSGAKAVVITRTVGDAVAPDWPCNLWEPLDGPGSQDFGARGVLDDPSHAASPELWLSQHLRFVTAAALLSVGAVAVGVLR